jgi:hypothetical protein
MTVRLPVVMLSLSKFNAVIAGLPRNLIIEVFHCRGLRGEPAMTIVKKYSQKNE